MTLSELPRYRGALAGALAFVVVGTLFGEPWLVALAGIPVSFVAYGSLSGVPDPSIALSRTAEPERPVPGDRVRIRLTVRNESDRPLPDVRVVDGVPEDLEVVSGSPQAALAIAPDSEESFEYELLAKRGEHDFTEPRVRVRGAAGGSYRDLEVPISGAERVTGRVFVEEPPTRRETATLVGAVPTDVGGSGIEFHTTREYRPGDPVNRIDWRRLARQGELSTVNYREHRGVAVVVVADCRPRVDVVPRPGAFSTVDLCRYAADRVLQAFVDEGQEVGIGVLGRRSKPWVEPGTTDTLARGRVALRSVNDGEWAGPELQLSTVSDGAVLVDRLASRLPAGGQVVFVTPLTDDYPIDVAEGLVVRGHPVTVVTPDLGDPDEPGSRLLAVERHTRVERLRDVGAHVVDWTRSDPLPLAVEAAEVRT